MERGYTLIELMITVGLLAVLALFAVPSFQDSIARNARESAMLDLMSSLALTRTEAVTSGRAVSICRSADQNDCAGAAGDWAEGWLVFGDQGTAGEIDGADAPVQVGSPLAVGGVVTLWSAAGAAVADDYLRFDREGFLRHPAGGAWFKFCTESNVQAEARAVWVANTGRVSLSSAGADGIHHDMNGADISCP